MSWQLRQMHAFCALRPRWKEQFVLPGAAKRSLQAALGCIASMMFDRNEEESTTRKRKNVKWRCLGVTNLQHL